MVPIGSGNLNWGKILPAAEAAGVEWFIIEQDQWYQRTPMEAAQMSMDTLKKIGLK